MDSLSELWEAWFTKRGEMVSLSPPAGATAGEMELGARVTEVLPRLVPVDGPTERIAVVESATLWLQAAWFEPKPARG